MTGGVTGTRTTPPTAGSAALAAAGLFGVALMAHLFPAPLALAGVALGGVLLLMLAFPDLATVVTLFAVYTNVTVIAAHRFDGVSVYMAGAVVLLLLVPLAHHVVARRKPFRVDGAFGLMVAYLGVMLFSTFGAVDRGLAIRHMFTYATEGLLVYMLVLNVVRDLPAVRKVVRTLLLAGSLLGALTLYQGVTGNYEQTFGGLASRNLEFVEEGVDPADLRPDEEMQRADRAGGPVGGPNRFAQILIVLLPLALMEYRNARTRTGRLAATGAGVLLLGGIFLTYSRGAFLTLAGLVLLLAVLREIPWRYVILGGGALMLGVGIVAPGYYDRIGTIEEVRGVVDPERLEEAGPVTRGRLTEMLAALWTWRDHPVVGVGPGQYMPYYSEPYQLRPEIDFRHLPKPRRAHNLYVEVAAEAGAVGLVLFVAIPGLLLLGLWRQRRRWSRRRPGLARLATGFGLAIVAYHGTGMFLHLAFERYYWLVLAVTAAALHALRSADPASAGEEGGVVRHVSGRGRSRREGGAPASTSAPRVGPVLLPGRR